jgi:hypothetical protein
VNAALLALALWAAQVGVDKEIEEPTTKTRMAIMSFAAAGVPEDYAAGITETIATAADQTGVFETVSPRQIQSLLAYEKRKEVLGGCVDESCYVQVAKLVKAPHLIGGTVSQVGQKLTLNLVLIDAVEGKAMRRHQEETTDASDLMDAARHGIIVLLQPVLNARQGYLKVAVNIDDAQIVVDDERKKEGVGQVISLSAGPHVLKVKRDGFYSTTADVFVRPGRVSVEDVKLIPAKETIQEYESSANAWRISAYVLGALSVGTAVASGIFYARATDDLNTVNSFASLNNEQQSLSPQLREDAIAADDRFGTNQALYLSFIAGALVSGGISLYLFLAGDDPERYEEFHSLAGVD